MQSPNPSQPAAHDPRIARIVRRHAHDVRNYINSLDLEATLLEDVVTDPDATDSLARMRGQLKQLEATVRSLSYKFSEPQPTTLTASDLFRLWMLQVQPMEDATHSLDARGPTDLKVLEIDPNAVVSVLRDLVVGAWHRCAGAKLKVSVRASQTEVIAELREPLPRSASVEESVREHELLIAVNGGRLDYVVHHDAGEAVTTASFPVVVE